MRMPAVLRPDYERYEGVRTVNIYLLRLLFLLVFVFVGYDSWTYILNHKGSWDHVKALYVGIVFVTVDYWGLSSPEDAPLGDVRDYLQDRMAHHRCLPVVVSEPTGRLARGGNDQRISLGRLAHCCDALEVCRRSVRLVRQSLEAASGSDTPARFSFS